MTTARKFAGWLTSRQADLLWKLMAAAALVLSVLVGVRQIQLTSCQGRYNEASNISQRARAEAAEADRRALDDLLQVVADEPNSALTAIRKYNAIRAAADAQRAQNPVPPSPHETCG